MEPTSRCLIVEFDAIEELIGGAAELVVEVGGKDVGEEELSLLSEEKEVVLVPLEEEVGILVDVEVSILLIIVIVGLAVEELADILLNFSVASEAVVAKEVEGVEEIVGEVEEEVLLTGFEQVRSGRSSRREPSDMRAIFSRRTL